MIDSNSIPLFQFQRFKFSGFSHGHSLATQVVSVNCENPWNALEAMTCRQTKPQFAVHRALKVLVDEKLSDGRAPNECSRLDGEGVSSMEGRMTLQDLKGLKDKD